MLLLSKYSLESKIATGGNSEVWLIKDEKGNSFAAKISFSDYECQELLLAEAKFMDSLPSDSPFLKYYGLYKYNDLPVMVIEYFPGKPLSQVSGISKDKIYFIAYHIFLTLNYLHERDFICGDLHGNNILYSGDRVVLIDLNAFHYEDISENMFSFL